jgi:hypothetical protein
MALCPSGPPPNRLSWAIVIGPDGAVSLPRCARGEEIFFLAFFYKSVAPTGLGVAPASGGPMQRGNELKI